MRMSSKSIRRQTVCMTCYVKQRGRGTHPVLNRTHMHTLAATFARRRREVGVLVGLRSGSTRASLGRAAANALPDRGFLLYSSYSLYSLDLVLLRTRTIASEKGHFRCQANRCWPGPTRRARSQL